MDGEANLPDSISPEIENQPIEIWINMVRQLESLYYSLKPETREKHNMLFHMTLASCVALKREVFDNSKK